MKCELCHKRDAAGVLHRKDANGDDEELYVCEDCLKSGGDADGKSATPTEKRAERDLRPCTRHSQVKVAVRMRARKACSQEIPATTRSQHRSGKVSELSVVSCKVSGSSILGSRF